MATEVIKIIDPDLGAGADYDSLYDWEAAQQGDLTGGRDEIAVAKCRCTGGTADTTAVTIDGWTTSSTQYVKIWTDPAEGYRHAGKWSTGNKYRLVLTNDWYSIICNASYTRFEGLQVSNTGGADIIHVESSLTGMRFGYCIIHGANGYSEAIYCGASYTAIGWIIYNSIFYDHGNYAVWLRGGGSGNIMFNCTVHNCLYGVMHTAPNSLLLKNNIFLSCTVPASPGYNYAAGSGYNATDVSSMGYTVTGGAVGDRISQTFSFVDEANDDFHLASNDAGALGHGTNLYNDASFPFQTDIDGQDRGGSGATWDIGADEYVSAGAQTYTRTVSLDSLVQKTLSRTASLDAYLQKSIPVTLSIDSLLQVLGTRTAALDALLGATGLTRAASLDALLTRSGVTASHSIDALINKEGISAATGIDALLIQAATYSLTASLDALVSKSGMVAALSLDAIAQKAQALTAALDAYLQATGQKTVSIDAMVQIAAVRTAAFDACLNATGLTRAASLDALLAASGLTRSASLDACLNRAGMGAATAIDALLNQVGLTRAASIDALLNKAGLTRSASLDALINQSGRTAGTALDAILYSIASGQIGAGLDALLAATGLTRAASLDAMIYASAALSAALDAVITRSMVQSLTLDAMLQKSGLTSTVQMDAWLYALRTIAPQLDAVITRTFGPQVGLDAILSGAGNYQLISLDALLVRGEIRLASLDAIVFGELSHAVNMDGLLQRPNAAAATLLDAIVYSALAVALAKVRFVASLPRPSHVARVPRAAFISRLGRPAFAAT